MRTVARNCPALSSLNIRCCGRVTDAGVVAVAEACGELKHICADATRISGAAARALADCCPLLTAVSLDHVVRLRSDDVAHLLGKLPGLQHLGLEVSSLFRGAEAGPVQRTLLTAPRRCPRSPPHTAPSG